VAWHKRDKPRGRAVAASSAVSPAASSLDPAASLPDPAGPRAARRSRSRCRDGRVALPGARAWPSSALALALTYAGITGGCGDDAGTASTASTRGTDTGDASGTVGPGTSATDGGSGSTAPTSASGTAASSDASTTTGTTATGSGSPTTSTTATTAASSTDTSATDGSASAGGSTDTGGTAGTGTATDTGTDTSGEVAVPCEAFDVVGHRGASYTHPEDTLVAVEQAFIEGAKLVEIDIRTSADGRVVLMHDREIDRTTSGSGPVGNFTVAQLAALDAGRWRAPEFVGEPVPTLVQALELAERYDRRLYLDIKESGMQAAIAGDMAAVGVPADRVYLSLNSEAEVDVYHAVLPDTPITYWGGLAAPSDRAWFEMMRAKNVVVLEQGWPWHRDSDFPQYRALADELGLRLGAFTVNQYEYLREGVEGGLDWIETDIPRALHDIACLGGDGGPPPPQRATGSWSFAQGLVGEVGSALRHFGPATPPSQQEQLGTAAGFGLPPVGGPAGANKPVLRVPAFTAAHGIELFTNLNPWGESVSNTAFNAYTLIFDVLKPQSAYDAGQWTPLLQTSFGNGNDAEIYIDPSGRLGINGTYHGQVPADTWVRIVLVVNITDAGPSTMTKYIDGVAVGSNDVAGVDGRFSLESNYVLGHALLFTDDGGETSELYVSAIQLRDYAMSPAAVQALGAAAATGIPLP
jgi:glycerophosphoryl diester phosphodiesterase